MAHYGTDFTKVAEQLAQREDPEDTPDEEKVTYDASCHCKAIQYTVRIPPLDGPKPHLVSQCNCSYCTKAGYILVFPKKENVRFVKGEDQLRSYRFATKSVDHKFCPHCGSNLFVDTLGQNHDGYRLLMSVRMFRGVDLNSLRYLYLDGRNLMNPDLNVTTL